MGRRALPPTREKTRKGMPFIKWWCTTRSNSDSTRSTYVYESTENPIRTDCDSACELDGIFYRHTPQCEYFLRSSSTPRGFRHRTIGWPLGPAEFICPMKPSVNHAWWTTSEWPVIRALNRPIPGEAVPTEF